MTPQQIQELIAGIGAQNPEQLKQKFMEMVRDHGQNPLNLLAKFQQFLGQNASNATQTPRPSADGARPKPQPQDNSVVKGFAEAIFQLLTALSSGNPEAALGTVMPKMVGTLIGLLGQCFAGLFHNLLGIPKEDVNKVINAAGSAFEQYMHRNVEMAKKYTPGFEAFKAKQQEEAAMRAQQAAQAGMDDDGRPRPGLQPDFMSVD